MKKTIVLFLIFGSVLISQSKTKEQIEVIDKAFKMFSYSPFSSLFLSGGAFYSGDDVDQLPMMVDYFAKDSGNSQNIKTIDGLFGSIIFEASVKNNNMDIYIAQYQTNYKTTLSSFKFDEPIMRFPKVYADIIQYKFIDLDKKIISTNIVLGKNWHTLEIGYRDRVDEIIFSAKTMRVRTFKTKALDNIISINLGTYEVVSGIPYPKLFVVESAVDKREIRFNVTNVLINNNAIKEAKQIGW